MARAAELDDRGLANALPKVLGVGTLPAQIHDSLEMAIIRGDLEPGTRLHPERLAAHFGISRIPVREALSSLQEAGWVEIRPRYGVYVRERSATEMAELFEMRAALEGQVARWAAARRSDEELAQLAAAVRQSRSAVDSHDPLGVLGLSSQFYAALRLAAHNSVMAPISAALEKRAQFYFSTVVDELGADWVFVHEQLLDLIEQGDVDRAGELTHDHIENTGRAVAALLGYTA